MYHFTQINFLHTSNLFQIPALLNGCKNVTYLKKNNYNKVIKYKQTSF